MTSVCSGAGFEEAAGHSAFRDDVNSDGPGAAGTVTGEGSAVVGFIDAGVDLAAGHEKSEKGFQVRVCQVGHIELHFQSYVIIG